LFHIFPVVESLSRFVDQRVRVNSVSAESTLTRGNTVPVNVDAILFWVVWNAEKAILEVQDFTEAVVMSAQTALLESIDGTSWRKWCGAGDDGGASCSAILDE